MPGMRIIDESDDGFSWTSAGHSWLARTSHALRANGDVWIVDPVDFPALDERVRALGSPRAVLKLFVQHGRDGSTVASRLGVPLLELPAQPSRIAVRARARPGPRGVVGDRPLVAGARDARRRGGGRERPPLLRVGAAARRPPGSARSCGHRRCSSGSSPGTCSSGTAPGCTRPCPSSCAPRSSGRAVTSCVSCRISSPLDSIPPASRRSAPACSASQTSVRRRRNGVTRNLQTR